MSKTTENKFQTVIKKNTYYFVNNEFEEKYESYLNSITDRLLVLKNKIDTENLKKEYFEELLKEKNGLIALLALSGFSNESFKRLLTVIRVLSNNELNNKLFVHKWSFYESLLYSIKLLKDLNIINNFNQETINVLNTISCFSNFNISKIINTKNSIKKANKKDYNNIKLYCIRNFKYKKNDLITLDNSDFELNIKNIVEYLLENIVISTEEWTNEQITLLIASNESFIKGLVNLFFEGSTINTLVKHLPLFEINKLSIKKLSFSTEELIDSLIRYKEKGSYSGNKNNNSEIIIEKILNKLEIPWETGDLKGLVGHDATIKRTMDFIIPNKIEPKIIIESSFLVTTSSGQGDKAKTENQVKDLIKRKFPSATFIGFIDGIGWYVRKGDLKRMVTAYEDVFTFHKDELERFEKFIIKILENAK